jgi:hypothetical protein
LPKGESRVGFFQILWVEVLVVKGNRERVEQSDAPALDFQDALGPR